MARHRFPNLLFNRAGLKFRLSLTVHTPKPNSFYTSRAFLPILYNWSDFPLPLLTSLSPKYSPAGQLFIGWIAKIIPVEPKDLANEVIQNYRMLSISEEEGWLLSMWWKWGMYKNNWILCRWFNTKPFYLENKWSIQRYFPMLYSETEENATYSALLITVMFWVCLEKSTHFAHLWGQQLNTLLIFNSCQVPRLQHYPFMDS